MEKFGAIQRKHKNLESFYQFVIRNDIVLFFYLRIQEKHFIYIAY